MLDLMKWTLSNLSLIGDFSDVGKGFWLPTPIRLIKLPDDNYFTVIGCIGFSQLKNILPKVNASGIGRIIKKDDIPGSILANKNVWQEFDDWVGWLPKDFMSWVKSECENVQNYGSFSSTTFKEFEVFLSNNPYTYNTKRLWLHYETFSSYGISENVMLCRTLSTQRSYFLGVFDKGTLRKERVLKDTGKINWLTNGLRLLHKSKITATWIGNELQLILVPQEIDRFLSVFSYRVPSKSGFPKYYIYSKYKNSINLFLSKFGYSIVERGANANELD